MKQNPGSPLLRTSRVKVAERMGLATLRSGPNGPMPPALPVRLAAHRSQTLRLYVVDLQRPSFFADSLRTN